MSLQYRPDHAQYWRIGSYEVGPDLEFHQVQGPALPLAVGMEEVRQKFLERAAWAEAAARRARDGREHDLALIAEVEADTWREAARDMVRYADHGQK